VSRQVALSTASAARPSKPPCPHILVAFVVTIIAKKEEGKANVNIINDFYTFSSLFKPYIFSMLLDKKKAASEKIQLSLVKKFTVSCRSYCSLFVVTILQICPTK
jgi:hypothetical protein